MTDQIRCDDCGSFHSLAKIPPDAIRQAFDKWCQGRRIIETHPESFTAGAKWAAKEALYMLYLAHQEGAISERHRKVMDVALRDRFGMEEEA